MGISKPTLYNYLAEAWVTLPGFRTGRFFSYAYSNTSPA